MSEMTIFKGKYYSEQYGTLRTIYDAEEMKALFCAKDIAKAFGYTNPSASVADICVNCVKEAHMTDGGLQVMNFIGWDDIARLYHRCRNQELYPYIEYLCSIETDMIEKAVEKDDDYEDDYDENCPYCDVMKYGSTSEYCEGACFKCEYSAACIDYCSGNCDSCQMNDECNASELPSADLYEDTHNPDYEELIERLTTNKNKSNTKDLINELAELAVDLCNIVLQAYEREDVA